MKVPNSLSTAFGADFEEVLSRFASERKLLSTPELIRSTRFLSRSIVPHVKKLSSLFNREEGSASDSLVAYWGASSNPSHLRLAYFLYFMPANLFRAAAVWSELGRLGFRWPVQLLRGIEIGAGPASGASGIAAGEHHLPTGLPLQGHWALVEQDRPMLELGSQWAKTYFSAEGFDRWAVRSFHRKIDLNSEEILPRNAPRFNLWIMSYFLNEVSFSPAEIARKLFHAWKFHLEEDGIAILIEPALKLQSRKLLEVRKELLALFKKSSQETFQVLLPCLGHQACGALREAEDWCHEEVSWWRPPYFKTIDQLAGLDRKTLPFSYLTIIRSSRAIDEILPALKSSHPSDKHRLVSPAYNQGRDLEFFICGQDGKRRARFHAVEGQEIGRGTIFTDVEIRGDVHASRIERVKKIL